MRVTILAAALAAAVSVVAAGCKEEPKPADKPAPATPSMTPPAAPSMTPPTMPSMTPPSMVPPSMLPPSMTMPSTMPSMAPPLMPSTMPSMPSTMPATADDADGASAKATGLYAKAMDAVKKTDWKAAKGYLGQLDGLKSKLSPEWQSKIESLQKMVSAGENPGSLIPGGPMTLPSLPGGLGR